MQAYLASSSEEQPEGEGDASALRERYRALLLANSNGDDARTGGPKGRAWGSGDPNSEAEDSDSDAAEVDGDVPKVLLLMLAACSSLAGFGLLLGKPGARCHKYNQALVWCHQLAVPCEAHQRGRVSKLLSSS